MVDQVKKTEPVTIEQDDDLPPRPTKLSQAATKEVFGGMINLGNDDALNAMEEG